MLHITASAAYHPHQEMPQARDAGSRSTQYVCVFCFLLPPQHPTTILCWPPPLSLFPVNNNVSDHDSASDEIITLIRMIPRLVQESRTLDHRSCLGQSSPLLPLST